MWQILGEMSPYLLFGFLIAGILSVLILPEVVEKHLGQKGLLSVIKAALIGIPLPLCSCSVIPIAASLKKSGASNGATISFLISTPQNGVDSIMVLFALLGPVFAVFVPVVTFVSGIIGGILVNLFGSDKTIIIESDHSECSDDCCPKRSPKNKILQALHYGYVTMPKDIGKALLVGLLIAGVISAIVPKDFFAGLFGNGIGSMLVMLLISIPLYVCATASIPVAAALILKGITPGAALVFLMAGPATNAATIATIWKIMGKKTAIIYLLTMATTALLSGIILDGIFKINNITFTSLNEASLPWQLETISSVLVLLILTQAIFEPFIKRITSYFYKNPINIK